MSDIHERIFTALLYPGATDRPQNENEAREWMRALAASGTTLDALSDFVVELSRLESKNRPDLQGIVFGRGFAFHQSLVDDAISNVRARLSGAVTEREP